MFEFFKSPLSVLAIGLISIGFSKGCDYLSQRVPYLHARRKPFMIAALSLSMVFLLGLGQIPIRYALNDVFHENQDVAPAIKEPAPASTIEH
ncbi:hypothetical protein [Azotobacter vinelandii]